MKTKKKKRRLRKTKEEEENEQVKKEKKKRRGRMEIYLGQITNSIHFHSFIKTMSVESGTKNSIRETAKRREREEDSKHKQYYKKF